MRYLILFLCLFANILLAQSPITQQLPVTFATNLLTIDLAENGQGFSAGTCGFLLKTTDGGNNWAIVDSPAENEDLSKIRCRPGTNCQQVFATSTQTLYRSLDGGSTWTETDIPGNGSILDIVFTGDDQTVILSRNVTTMTFSSDNGATLEQRSIGHAPATPMQFVDQQIGFFFSNMRRLIATEDGGVTWTERYEHTEGIRGMNFVDANNGFFYNADGVLFSTADGGSNWTEVSTYANIRFLFEGMATRTRDTVEIFTTRGVHRSTDGGASFTELININSLNSNFGDNRVGEIRRVGTDYWMACSNSAVLYSADDFENINQQIAGARPAFRDIAISEDKIFALTFQDGLYRSYDGGITYQLVPDDDFITGYDLNVAPNGSIIVSGNGAPKISPDDGLTLERLLPNDAPDQIYRAVERLTDGRIVVAGEGGTTLYSDDSGATWTTGGNHDLSGTLLSVSSAGQIVSINTRDGYAISTDGGDTWTTRPMPENVGVQPRFFVVDANNWLVSAFPSGRLQHSPDGGDTWEDTNTRAFAIVADDNGRLYGLDNDQILFSESMGARWESATDEFCSPIGLEQGNLVYDAANERLLVGTFGHRVFTVDVSDLVSSTRPTVRPQTLRAYPNPTDGRIVIELPSTGASSSIDVQLISAAGQLVRQQRYAAAPQLNLDLFGQPAGIYTVRVAGDGWVQVGRVVLSR
ncbi:MAG: YCF48-related protein [Bacteroidota bacterium]